MSRGAAGLAVALALFAPPAAVDAGPVEKAKSKVAKVWVEYARWCKAYRLKAEATDALARAEELDAGAKDLAALKSAVDTLDSAASADDVSGFEKRRAKAHKDAAKACERVAKAVDGDASGLWWCRALALQQDKRRAGRLAAAAKKGGLLIRAPGHPMAGLLTLPKAWNTRKTWPILVSVEGAGCNFAGNHRRFATARGKRPWIVLTPMSLSNTNALQKKKYAHYPQALLDEHNAKRIDFDLAGLRALRAFVRDHFGGAKRIGITGFSGGGNLCYGYLARHPDDVRFAAPACANFSGQGFQGAKRLEDGGPPVHIMTGAKDPHREFTHGNRNSPGIEPQTDRAVEVLKRLGFTRVKRTLLPGKGHSTLAPEVWAFADEQK